MQIPEDAKDLIRSLLKKDPSERLGVGQYGTPNDMNALKNHPFFKTIDFSKVFLMIPPFDFNKYKRSSLRRILVEQKQIDESNDIYQSFVGGLGEEFDHMQDNPGSPTKRVKQKVLATSHLKK